MNRRRFLALSTGALAAGALATTVGLAAAPAATGPLNAAAFKAARRYARTRFGRIAYVERGRGAAALFLHGFPLNSFQWRGAIERLAPYRRCVAPDFMGLGHTEVAEGQSVAPDAQVEMLLALMDRLSIERADLIASDSGGAVAQLLLARHPERVRSLLLTNCDTEIECPPAAMLPVIALSREGKFVDQWLAPWHADHALARSPDGIGGMCYLDPSHPSDEAIDSYFSPLVASAQSKARVHAYAVALDHNVLEGVGAALKRSTAPVRVVWGMGDTIFSPAGAEHLERSFGRYQGTRRLEGSKLFWPEERPDVIAEEALRLWDAA
ncbi:alpha/beta fold hydrolase [Lysobacter sp. cf310]|uniref:alpha/beta fold hydrolase n=1 Tax=Lysobacter sp. cf310 TaxID=1761790 RepID=UPI0008F40C69|nr:alpha/beta hydrolase [Lysobacter sp. cf310]SFK79661.1 Pimeloyl-ACP methyl ester carboxylesterase [Lysobacter sp. cf310]